jgi:hypothetical protein
VQTIILGRHADRIALARRCGATYVVSERGDALGGRIEPVWYSTVRRISTPFQMNSRAMNAREAIEVIIERAEFDPICNERFKADGGARPPWIVSQCPSASCGVLYATTSSTEAPGNRREAHSAQVFAINSLVIACVTTAGQEDGQAFVCRNIEQHVRTRGRHPLTCHPSTDTWHGYRGRNTSNVVPDCSDEFTRMSP